MKHNFVPMGKKSDQCAVKLGAGKQCRKPASSQIHRYYPCRTRYCPDDHFLSIEARDRHEANKHGEGW